MLSWQHLLLVLLVVVVLFGTKKLRNVGSDLGAAVKGFKKAMQEEQPKDAEFKSLENENTQQQTSEKAKDKEQA